MKKTWIWICLSIFGIWACESEKKENGELSQENIAKPEWNNTDTLESMIHSFFFKNTVEQGSFFYQHKDPMTGEVNMIQLTSTNFDSVYQTSENSATMAYRGIRYEGDTILLDCQFIWDPSFSKTDQSFGRYELKTIFIRQKDGKYRYTWQKNGKYWDKVFPNQQQPKVQ